jgi:hypothetical protein
VCLTTAQPPSISIRINPRFAFIFACFFPTFGCKFSGVQSVSQSTIVSDAFVLSAGTTVESVDGSEFNSPFVFRIRTATAVSVIAAESDDDRTKWLNALVQLPGCSLIRGTRADHDSRPPPPPPRHTRALSSSGVAKVDLRRMSATDMAAALPAPAPKPAAAPASPTHVASPAPASTIRSMTQQAPQPAAQPVVQTVQAAPVASPAATPAVAAESPASAPVESGTASSSTATATARIRQGWLEKVGDRVKTWKRRWCSITGPSLCYYKEETVRSFFLL